MTPPRSSLLTITPRLTSPPCLPCLDTEWHSVKTFSRQAYLVRVWWIILMEVEQEQWGSRASRCEPSRIIIMDDILGSVWGFIYQILITFCQNSQYLLDSLHIFHTQNKATKSHYCHTMLDSVYLHIFVKTFFIQPKFFKVSLGIFSTIKYVYLMLWTVWYEARYFSQFVFIY